jgi:hypothetical protein
MKYRKKPVVIEAFKYDRILHREMINVGDVPAWLVDAFYNATLYYAKPLGPTFKAGLYVRTLGGEFKVYIGDYIIKGVNGELYPCKPDIFEATYEPAENGKLTATIMIDGATIGRAIKKAIEKQNCIY